MKDYIRQGKRERFGKATTSNVNRKLEKEFFIIPNSRKESRPDV